MGFADPCILPAHPGWPLRNLLFLLALKWGVRRVTVLSLRGSKAKSLVFRVSLPAIGAVRKGTPVGWEKNAEGKLVPRVVNLQSSMDPTKYAHVVIASVGYVCPSTAHITLDANDPPS